MYFSLEIESDNDALRTSTELIEVLRKVATRLESEPLSANSETEGTIRDVNGNKVGTWFFDPVTDEDDGEEEDDEDDED